MKDEQDQMLNTRAQVELINYIWSTFFFATPFLRDRPISCTIGPLYLTIVHSMVS